MIKIHVLPDESLGGVLREYVKVDRKVTVEDFAKGKYVLVDGVYRAIEPTDVVVIDNQRYRLVDRKAKVGEKVIVVDASLNGESYKNGDIFIVREVRHSVIFVTVDFGRYIALSHFEYNVLDPVEPAELVTAEEGNDKSVIDLLANLARRVTELERKLGEYARKIDGIEADIQNINVDLGTVEETTKELERAYETLKRRQVIENIHVLKRRQERLFEEINAIYRRIDALDERTQPLVKPFGEESPFATVATIPTFKFSELIGKTLKIYGGRDGEYATVFGYDELTGKSYVLFNGKEADN